MRELNSKEIETFLNPRHIEGAVYSILLMLGCIIDYNSSKVCVKRITILNQCSFFTDNKTTEVYYNDGIDNKMIYRLTE